jgi:hypothetical protein
MTLLEEDPNWVSVQLQQASGPAPAPAAGPAPSAAANTAPRAVGHNGGRNGKNPVGPG